MIILIHHQMHNRLHLNIRNLKICIIFKHIDPDKKMYNMIRRQMKMKLFILLNNLETKLMI